MGSPDFNYIFELSGFIAKRFSECNQRWNQGLINTLNCRDMHRRGKSIIRRLTHIYMIVRMNRIFRTYDTPSQFNATISNDLIAVHV